MKPEKFLCQVVALLACISSLSAQPVWTDGIQTVNAGAYPNLVAHPGGGLAITWAATTGQTSGTWQQPYPAHWRSEIYTAFSADDGQTWTDPAPLSDPSLHSNQPDVVPGSLPGEFLFTWASGDPFSGYRQHIAKTSDYGQTFTSSTRVQTFMEPGQGALIPDIALIGENPIVSWAAVNQDHPDRPFEWYTSNLSSTIDQWSEPVSLATLGSWLPRKPPLAVGGSTLMVAGSITSTSVTHPSPRIFIRRSENGGASWPTTIYPSTNPEVYSITPTVASDGKGTWILLYYGSFSPREENIRFGSLYYQRSTDDGLTWTSSTAMTSTSRLPTYSPTGLATDGNGRWVAISHSSFSYSSDNGLTWNDWDRIPNSVAQANPGSITYLGNNKWGLLSRQWTAPAGLYLRILQWAPATVTDWTLY